MPAKPAKPDQLPEVAGAEPGPELAPGPTAEPDADLEPTAPPDTSGWYRNRGPVELTVMPDRYPSAVLKPGGAEWFPADPSHPDLEPCDAPPAAADSAE